MLKLNLNTVMLSLILPAMIYLAHAQHDLDVRLARIEQQLIDRGQMKGN